MSEYRFLGRLPVFSWKFYLCFCVLILGFQMPSWSLGRLQVFPWKFFLLVSVLEFYLLFPADPLFPDALPCCGDWQIISMFRAIVMRLYRFLGRLPVFSLEVLSLSFCANPLLPDAFWHYPWLSPYVWVVILTVNVKVAWNPGLSTTSLRAALKIV